MKNTAKCFSRAKGAKEQEANPDEGAGIHRRDQEEECIFMGRKTACVFVQEPLSQWEDCPGIQNWTMVKLAGEWNSRLKLKITGSVEC